MTGNRAISRNSTKVKDMSWTSGNYRGLKMTDQVMKTLEHLMESYVLGMVDIDGFISRRVTST